MKYAWYNTKTKKNNLTNLQNITHDKKKALNEHQQWLIQTVADN